MYQGAIEIRKCKACGKSYEQQMGTLAIKSHSFNTCPYCGGSTEPDQKKNEERHEKIEERFKRLYKIAELKGCLAKISKL